MRQFTVTLFVFTLFTSIVAPAAYAMSTIKITSPVNGQQLAIQDKNLLTYQATLAGDDDHFFVYIDGEKVQLLRRTHGKYELGRLLLGKHEVCIKVAYKDHLLTGLQDCVNIEISPPVKTVNYGNTP